MRREVDGHLVVARFDPDTAMWRTFLVAYHAGERGATDAEWKKAYPAAELVSWKDRRKTKSRVAERLHPLGVQFAKGSLVLELL